MKLKVPSKAPRDLMLASIFSSISSDFWEYGREKRQQQHPVLYLTLNYCQCQGKNITMVVKIGLLLCWSIFWLKYVKLLLC